MEFIDPTPIPLGFSSQHGQCGPRIEDLPFCTKQSLTTCEDCSMFWACLAVWGATGTIILEDLDKILGYAHVKILCVHRVNSLCKYRTYDSCWALLCQIFIYYRKQCLTTSNLKRPFLCTKLCILAHVRLYGNKGNGFGKFYDHLEVFLVTWNR